MARNLALTELARRLQPSVGFIGHDSGITHLAAALDLAGLVLWGDTNQAVWRPRSERMIVLPQFRGPGGISVEAVLERLPRVLAAS